MGSLKKIQTAKKYGIANAGRAFLAARKVGLPYFVAVALLEKESGGRNVWGNDTGGMLAGFHRPVNEWTYKAFRHEVKRGRTSNGVGPCQITWPGFFDQMEKRGLKPWVAMDNMIFGFELLKSYHDASGSWIDAGERYNGARAYGVDLDARITRWRARIL